MAEIRYNPLLKDWVMVASHRQNRPQLPKDWCPFCPGSGRVPDDYEVYKYDNDFPALSQQPPLPDDVATPLFKTAEAYGKCEVILYSPEHTTTLAELPESHVKKLVDLWCERFDALSRDKRIKYILIFENRGEVVGVTMPHPHGQIYGYPYVPKKPEIELEACLEHYAKKGTCLLCDILQEEVKQEKRIIFENKDFITVLPFFTEYPYGMFIYSRRHVPAMTGFSESERVNLARAIKHAAGTLDALFDYMFPYMMCMHQTPVNRHDGSDVSKYCHFHIEFYPPMRSRDRQKFNASSETGAWAPCNPTSPEEKAGELRNAYRKYMDKNT